MPIGKDDHPEPEAGSDPQPNSEMLLWAYCRGLFPMADPIEGRVGWYCPDLRGVIPLDEFRVPKSLARVVRHGKLEIRADTAFEAVMRACAEPRGDDNLSWIDESLIRAYCGLYARGCAHSVEAWRNDRLVGGLYGVHIGGAFFGESMFVRARQGGSNASKVCLVHLVAHLRRRGFRLLDTQFWNEHLDQFGCVEIPRGEYLSLLAEVIGEPVSWGGFDPSATTAGGGDSNA